MVEKFKLTNEELKKHGVGYVPDRRYNERFGEQGLRCQYHHCIETIPLHEEEGREAVKRGMLIDLRKDPGFGFMVKDRIIRSPQEEPRLYKEIRRVLDERGIKDNECWFRPDLNTYISQFGQSRANCRLFGHQCPGGKEQVDKCAAEGMFD